MRTNTKKIIRKAKIKKVGKYYNLSSLLKILIKTKAIQPDKKQQLPMDIQTCMNSKPTKEASPV